MLWFEALGFAERFWTVIGAQWLAAAAAALASAALAWLLSRGVRAAPRALRIAVPAIAAGVGAAAGYAMWDEALLALHAVDSGVRDPLLGLDAGFYRFLLPLLDPLLTLATWVVLIATAGVLASGFDFEDGQQPALRASFDPEPLFAAAAALAVLLAPHFVTGIFHLLYSPLGAVWGPGWTDVHVRLPAQAVMAMLMLGLALMLRVPRWRGLLAIRR